MYNSAYFCPFRFVSPTLICFGHCKYFREKKSNSKIQFPKKKKKGLPTDPTFFGQGTRNTPIFFGLSIMLKTDFS